MELSQGFFTLQAMGDLVLCYPHPSALLLMASHWPWFGWNLSPASVGDETVSDQPEVLPADSAAAIEHWKQAVSGWEVMSHQCDTVCATLQSANKTGEILQINDLFNELFIQL